VVLLTDPCFSNNFLFSRASNVHCVQAVNVDDSFI